MQNVSIFGSVIHALFCLMIGAPKIKWTLMDCVKLTVRVWDGHVGFAPPPTKTLQRERTSTPKFVSKDSLPFLKSRKLKPKKGLELFNAHMPS